MVILKNVLMCIQKVKLINHDCLPLLMLLYIMLSYLMLLAALFNAVCLYNAFFLLLLIFANALSWLLTHSLFISSMIFHHVQCFFFFFFFPNSMFTPSLV